MSRFALRSNLAALAMVAATGGLLAGPVMAAAPADGGPAAMHQGPRDGGFHKGMRDGLWIPGLGPVSKAQLDQLKLDDKQQALVKTAQDGQRSLHEAMRASGGQRHDLLKAQLTAASSIRAHCWSNPTSRATSSARRPSRSAINGWPCGTA